ncbi:MAG TPA: site-2 protease family protein [Ardenticatenaceae bacterium]|nr:site-2 protease family protein [Ardenticatenaceae bacterium]
MWAWRLGSVRGIDLKIHFTFPLVLLWAAFQWGGGPGGGPGRALYGALLVSILFVCVLLHELGHSLAAMRYGIKVQDITLLPIGGVAQLRAMPDKPRQELVVALAGPAVNVAIVALLFPLVNLVSDGLSRYGLVRLLLGTGLSSMIVYIFAANISLVVFNLIPAFPMDGGRVLRALLAMRLDYNLATRIAVRLGQLLAIGFGLFGLLQNPLLILVALFVFFSAGAELRRVAVRDLLQGAQVTQFLAAAGQALSPSWPLPAARLVAHQTGQRAFPVIDAGQLVGLVSIADLNRLQFGHVGEVMHGDFPVLAPAATLYEAQAAMAALGQTAAAVVESGSLSGLISVGDVERAYAWLLQRRRPGVLRYA